MRKNGFVGLRVFVFLLLIGGLARAETVELVTYYPTSGNSGNLSGNSLAIGYPGTTPAYGTAIISGRLGIGTATPTRGLEVVSTGTANGGILVSGTAPGLYLANADGNGGVLGVATANGNYGEGVLAGDTSLSSQGGNLRLGTTDTAGENPTVRMSILTNGNVGIGTATPSQMLDVAGNIRMSGTRSVLLTQGANNTTHVGGVQFLTPNNGTTLIMTPTDATGTTVNNSTVTLGGLGNFNTNTVGLGVSGNLGVGRVYGPPSAAPNAQTNGNIDANDVYIRSANNGTGRWASQLGGSFFWWLTVLPRVLDVAWNQSSPSDSTAATGFVGAGAYTVYRTNWAAIDLNTYIAQANMGTPRAAIVTARVWHHTNGHGGHWGPEVGSELKLVTSTTGVPTDNADVRMVRALDIADDSVIIASDSAEFTIPLTNGRYIYWSRTSVRQNGQNYDANAQVNLEGFLY